MKIQQCWHLKGRKRLSQEKQRRSALLPKKILDLSDFPEMRDAKDSPILATAIMEKIDVFVTGDKDFLVLDVEMPEIVTMAEFLRQY